MKMGRRLVGKDLWGSLMAEGGRSVLTLLLEMLGKEELLMLMVCSMFRRALLLKMLLLLKILSHLDGR
jgi:hypothetical protein